MHSAACPDETIACECTAVTALDMHRRRVRGDAQVRQRGCREFGDACIGWLTLLQFELLHARLVGGDSGALDSNRVLLNGLSRIQSNLIVGLVTVGQTKVVVLEIDVKIRMDELILDVLPDDAGHLVTVELHDGILDLDLLGSHVVSGVVEECDGDSSSRARCRVQCVLEQDGPCVSGESSSRADRSNGPGVEGTHGGGFRG